MKTTPLYKKFDRALETVNFVLARIGGFLIVIAMVIIVADVIGRYFFGKPIIWVFYYSEYILVFSTFLAAAYVLKHNGHVKVDIVLNLFNKRQKAYISIFTSMMGLFVSIVIGWYALSETYEAFQNKTMFTAPIPMYQFPVKIIIPIGFLLLSLEWIRKLIFAFVYLSGGDVDLEEM